VIERIGSADDPRLDPYRHVGDPAWIRERQVFVAEGRLVVERLLALGRFEVQSILVNPAAHAAMHETLAGTSAPVLVCDPATVLSTVTGYNFHRGCLALVARPPAASPTDLLRWRRVLALEGVANPDNVGGLFRAAAALGVEGILLDRTSGDPLYRKAIRTSMGAALTVPFARAADWRAALAEFRSHGFHTVALTPATDAVPIADLAPVPTPLLVMVGAEGPGLEAATLAAADTRARIPIDSATDSLNVVVAAAIALDRLRQAGT
jgi:tRNA G18 (ribose-2'-O)-methylase SpoU